MLYRPNSEGLSLLEQVIRENSDRIDSDILDSLTDAYNRINDSHVSESYYHINFDDVCDHTDNVKEYIQNTMDEVTDLFTFGEVDSEEIDTIHEKVNAIITKIDYSKFDYEEDTSKQYELMTKEIEKMITTGYSFNAGLGLELTKARDKEERARKAESEQREKEQRFSSLWREKRPYEVSVKKVDSNKYEVRSYSMGINAVYDAETGKAKGKGSRNHKEEIQHSVSVFKELLKEVV